MTLKFTTCYAVTDHHMILSLEVVAVIPVHEFWRIETKLLGEITGASVCHHEAYFKTIWLDANGLPDRCNVFLNRTDATSYALKKAKTEIKKHMRAAEYLKKHATKLKREI